jgi:sialic acid synthase SpsE
MNNIASIKKSVAILRKHQVPFAVLNCTSMYPTPYDKVHPGAIAELRSAFPDAVVGQSDYSYGNYTCFAAIALVQLSSKNISLRTNAGLVPMFLYRLIQMDCVN